MSNGDIKPGPGGPATMAEKDQAFGHETTKELLSKGFTPRTTATDGPFGKSETSSWEDQRPQPNLWPVVTVIIAVLIFIVLMVQGAPWA